MSPRQSTDRRAGTGRRAGIARSAGFTLIEALVALALVLAFAATLGPFLFQARRIIAHADGRVAAQVLLRSLLAIPPDPASLANGVRDGETAGLRWRIVSEPIGLGAPAQDHVASLDEALSRKDRPSWIAYRVVASVSWAPGQTISAETVRLGTPE